MVADIRSVGKYFVVFLLLIFGVYTVYQFWWNWASQVNPSLAYKKEMEKVFSGKVLSDFVPITTRAGEIYWFDYERDKDMWRILSFADLYGIRVDSSTRPLRINGILRSKVVGFIACPGFDKDVDFLRAANSIVEYDPTNGTKSNGDIIFLFRR